MTWISKKFNKFNETFLNKKWFRKFFGSIIRKKVNVLRRYENIKSGSSCSQMFIKIVFWKIWQISQENTYVGVFFNKVAELVCNIIKRRLQHRRFYVKFAKFVRTVCFAEHRWLLPQINKGLNHNLVSE